MLVRTCLTRYGEAPNASLMIKGKVRGCPAVTGFSRARNMRMRSALTASVLTASVLAASVLAAGILLGGASTALADDGVDLDSFSGGHAAFASTCSTAAAIPAGFRPAYTSTCSNEGEKEWADFAHLGAI